MPLRLLSVFIPVSMQQRSFKLTSNLVVIVILVGANDVVLTLYFCRSKVATSTERKYKEASDVVDNSTDVTPLAVNFGVIEQYGRHAVAWPLILASLNILRRPGFHIVVVALIHR